MSADDVSAVRLLTRLFVRRLLDNDLVSPHADRHDSLGVLYAVVLSLALFVTFFVSTPYLAAYIQLPGQTALSALPDRFLFIAASLAISALAALLVWDALGLEPRDTAILGPLPIAPWTITRAKLLAALVFGVVFSIAINVVPTILYPTFLTVNLRGVSVGGIVRLIAAQAISVIMAGLFGFFAVLAVRGVLRLALGERGFARVSSGVQSLLVVAAVTCLMLTPTIRGKTVTEWIAGVVAPPVRRPAGAVAPRRQRNRGWRRDRRRASRDATPTHAAGLVAAGGRGASLRLSGVACESRNARALGVARRSCGGLPGGPDVRLEQPTPARTGGRPAARTLASVPRSAPSRCGSPEGIQRRKPGSSSRCTR